MTDLFETILIALACPLILPFVVDKEKNEDKEQEE